MDKAHRAILDTLPPTSRHSKLEPYGELIAALRRRGRSYREIVTILRDRCELRVGLHAVYHFVRTRSANQPSRGRRTGARASMTRTIARVRPDPAAGQQRPARGSKMIGVKEMNDRTDLETRINALKTRGTSRPGEGKEFAYDEDEPLELIRYRPKE